MDPSPLGDFYIANKPTNSLFNLSPLLSSTNNPLDIESVQSSFPSSTNAPTIRIGNTDKTIGSLFMNDADSDEIGIRGTPSNNLVYTNLQESRWFGSGILNKPIGDFYTGAGWFSMRGAPYFSFDLENSVHIYTRSRALPEPEEYALVFGIFALAFVIVRRHFQNT